MIGIPYAEAGVDSYGYYLTCPKCGARCRASKFDAHDEDGATKGAGRNYAKHYEGEHTPPPRLFCERRPYEGAGYHCYLDAGHDGPHSDLTLGWNDAGEFVNADGSVI
jgi:hypothetical protein